MLTIKFTDGELVQNVDWNSLPNKPISKVVVELNGHKISLSDYEEYNHLIEKSFSVIGNTIDIMRIMIMGRKDNQALVKVIDLLRDRTYEYTTEINKEYVRGFIGAGRPCTGWKKGS